MDKRRAFVRPCDRSRDSFKATGYRGKHRSVTHSGLQPGTTTVMHWFPDLRAGSVFLCNAEGPNLDALEENLLNLLGPR
jgi:hypothetical protein